MAKKDENLKRLKELSELLGREPDMSGSAADIAQRVAELEEELGDVDGTDSQASALTGQENNEVSAQPDTVTDTADLVTVVALVTLHTDALHATRDEAVAFVLPGTAFRVSAGVAAEMTERGLARMQ
ncbi:DNA-packaging protein FI [Shigella flexneri]|nr:MULTISPECIES: DNA-packaging protein FI [Enterobacteriaceae]APL03441.1 DNA-packaging protein FI [Escherichia coli]APL13224.1 DNA-packaging protein FI [Escherichia coli]APL22535.1 DNA-packaging protein FI [Escherichia coli]APL28314.1 DNA-packaging protein FI [Escherichia coli]APL37386.1 DNA-packaging protein FI [Escherichia coli]